MSRSAALIRPRWLFASSQPAAAIPAPSSGHGMSGTCRCARALVSHRYRAGFRGFGEYRSFEPYTEVAGGTRRLRGVRVMGAVHEDAGPVQQRAESFQEWLNGLRVAD